MKATLIAAAAVVAAAVAISALEVVRFDAVDVDPDLWTAASSTSAPLLAQCQTSCDAGAGCLAFAHDSGSSACETGPLPDDSAVVADGSGNKIFKKTFLTEGGAPSSCSASAAVSAGYSYLGGKYYKGEGVNLKSWADATAECQSVGGNLAHFKTEADLQIIKDIAETFPPEGDADSQLWIGIWNKDLADTCRDDNNNGLPDCDGILYWSDGTDYVRQAWMPDTDADDGRECVRIRPNANYKSGDTTSCTTQRSYICQVDCSI